MSHHDMLTTRLQFDSSPIYRLAWINFSEVKRVPAYQKRESGEPWMKRSFLSHKFSRRHIPTFLHASNTRFLPCPIDTNVVYDRCQNFLSFIRHVNQMDCFSQQIFLVRDIGFKVVRLASCRQHDAWRGRPGIHRCTIQWMVSLIICWHLHHPWWNIFAHAAVWIPCGGYFLK